MKIYNTLSKQVEDFVPIKPPHVGFYACGPTVYDFQHIGNLRTATLMDVTKRILKALGYDVKVVMNITDVDDKIENKAKKENLKVDDVTSKFEKIYMGHLAQMNISADVYPHASDLIKEQIEIIEVLLEKGFAYKNEFGIYFDISKDKNYGKLGNTFKSSKEKSRIGITEGKRNQEDFALWKFPLEGEDRQKLWDSPWGKGFPGWHIECSAMSMKYLSNAFDGGKFTPENYQTIDIHIGGEDLKETHHENELAQTECATGKKFVKYWLHGAMLNIGEEKMSKSLGNFLTLEEVLNRNIEPLALRYLYYTTHYKKQLNFTWESLESAQTALTKLRQLVQSFESGDKSNKGEEYKDQFNAAIGNDLNMPEALAVVWSMLKSDLPNSDKYNLAMSFDKVLGLDLGKSVSKEIPEEIKKLIVKREELRTTGNYEEADKIRDEIIEKGYTVKDESSPQ
ncbi:cysteine--tRNA ligase [soil metagenome]